MTQIEQRENFLHIVIDDIGLDIICEISEITLEEFENLKQGFRITLK